MLCVCVLLIRVEFWLVARLYTPLQEKENRAMAMLNFEKHRIIIIAYSRFCVKRGRVRLCMGKIIWRWLFLAHTWEIPLFIRLRILQDFAMLMTCLFIWILSLQYFSRSIFFLICFAHTLGYIEGDFFLLHILASPWLLFFSAKFPCHH